MCVIFHLPKLLIYFCHSPRLIMLMTFITGGHSKYQGPSFIHEPPNREIFYNNTGAVIPCVANGTPRPEVTWTTGDNITVTPVSGLRHIRPDGSLAFSPFRKEDYRSDVHSAVYRCSASNSAGSIVSRDVNVRGGKCY